MKKKNIYLSIVIPAYNEERRIVETICNISSYLDVNYFGYEIIVVNDGSTDKTLLVVEEMQQKYQNIFIVNSVSNFGKGHAVALGMSVAVGELRLFVDADNSVSIENLDRFILEIEKGSDIVIASIYKKGGVVSGVKNRVRQMLSMLASRIINSILEWDILDTQRGFKLFTKKSAEIIFKKLTTKRYLFDVEVLLLAKKNGFKIKELPVVWENKTGSKVRPIDFVRSVWEFLIIYWRS